MHADAMILGQFIKAAEFGTFLPKQPTYTITSAQHEEVASLKPGKEGMTEIKGVIYFREIPRGWVVNVTNKELLKALFGTDTEQWLGKRVTLHAEMVSLGRSQELGIRVFGSPELTEPKQVVVKLKKKKPQTFTLMPTGERRSAPAPSVPPTEMSLSDFKGWLADAVKNKGWPREAVAEKLGGPADAYPAEKRRELVALLKAGPPAPPVEEEPPAGDEAPPSDLF